MKFEEFITFIAVAVVVSHAFSSQFTLQPIGYYQQESINIAYFHVL